MKENIIRYEKEKRCTCTLYTTESCNLDCTYCYEWKKSTKSIPIEIAQIGIQETFQKAVDTNIDFVEILFHGGEPFIAFEKIKSICDWIWSREWPKKYICYATTNGTLIHDDKKEWLLKNKDRFVVGLSLDGTPEMHNRNRSNSFSKIDMDFFSNNWPDQGVKMTPSPGTLASLAEGVIYIHEVGFKRNNCTFASGVDWNKDEFGNDVAYEHILNEQLGILAQYYLEYPDLMPIDMLNIRFLAIAAGLQSMTDKLCGAGTIMKCWTPDGQCLPCHLFYEVSKENRIKLPEFDFTSLPELSDPMCIGCILEPICPTCYGGSFITYGDIVKRDPYTCNITKIRALAGSWMIGQMLAQPEKYAATKSYSRNELAMTAKGVLMTQNLFDV